MSRGTSDDVEVVGDERRRLFQCGRREGQGDFGRISALDDRLLDTEFVSSDASLAVGNDAHGVPSLKLFGAM